MGGEEVKPGETSPPPAEKTPRTRFPWGPNETKLLEILMDPSKKHTLREIAERLPGRMEGPVHEHIQRIRKGDAPLGDSIDVMQKKIDIYETSQTIDEMISRWNAEIKEPGVTISNFTARWRNRHDAVKRLQTLIEREQMIAGILVKQSLPKAYQKQRTQRSGPPVVDEAAGIVALINAINSLESAIGSLVERDRQILTTLIETRDIQKETRDIFKRLEAKGGKNNG